MGDTGYDFYISYGAVVLRLPITPSELSVKVGSNNKVVTLIDEGDINILKSPSLTEVQFTARFPMRVYPYSKLYTGFGSYLLAFETLKKMKQPCQFIVTRSTPRGLPTWNTNIQVALEDFTIKENADEGDDVLVDFTFREYKPYSSNPLLTILTKALTTSTSAVTRVANVATSATTYTISVGDCLWNLAKKHYGDGSKWKKIYEANKNVIEEAAKKHGRKSSSNGHWIYPGTKITIPKL